MVAAFRARFLDVRIECAAGEESDFFGRTFDGVVAWGLLFLLDAEVQRRLLAKVASVVPRGGRFLVTAPTELGSWADIMTGRTSISLGYEAYRNALEAEVCLSLEQTAIMLATTTISHRRHRLTADITRMTAPGSPAASF